MRVTLHRKAHFNAAHRLFNPAWSDAENLRVFGKCSNPHYHGHNYELIVSLTGPINLDTGMVAQLETLKQIIFEEVESPFDHKNINLEVPEFANLNPTVENIAQVIWEKIRKRLDDRCELEITLYETPRNFASCRAD